MSVGPALTIRPWQSEDGDPADPQQIFGMPVQNILARRADQTAVLVALPGNRYALTGRVTAMGRSIALLHYVRVKTHDARRKADRVWLDEVYRRLGQRQPDSAIRSGTPTATARRMS